MNGGCQPDKFDWIKFEQPWAARRAKPMDGWSNGELQEVIRNGRKPGIVPHLPPFKTDKPLIIQGNFYFYSILYTNLYTV